MKKNCLVAGPTCSGKTIFSRRLVDKHGFSRIPGDPLVLAFQNSFSELGIGHDKELYDSTCRQLGKFLVELMNALAWESTMPYVVDTFHVRPSDLQGIDESKTTVLFLGYPEDDPDEKAERSKRYRDEHGGADWLASSNADVSAMFRLFIEMSREVHEQCLGTRFAFIDTSRDLVQGLSRAEELATSQEKTYDR